jgi:hypothetical protein
MPYPWEKRDYLKAGIGSSGLWGHVFWLLGLVFAILGVVSDAINITIGIEPLSWFMLAAVVVLLGICMFIGWAVSWYLADKG